MSAQHTPGPWLVMRLGHQELRQTQIRDEDGELVIAALPTRDRTEANARLIAAAPEMLERLRGAHDFLRSLASPLDATGRLAAAEMEILRHTIAKAEGREP